MKIDWKMITIRKLSTASFIPECQPPDFRNVQVLQNILNSVEKLLVITGAGVSTESGIPDYRSEKVGRFATSKTKPTNYQEFVSSDHVRKKFWARNFVAWPKFSAFEPNLVHKTLAYWEQTGRLMWTISQNIDDLHRKAGSSRLTDLHGSGSRVKCLQCNFAEPRATFQYKLQRLNPHFNLGPGAAAVAPDGDVDLPDEMVKEFVTSDCSKCHGILKPDVVFFGDSVPADVVEFCNDKVDSADGLMVLGTSLQVFSAFRFVKRFSERSKPIFIVNIGATRADNLAKVKISSKCGDLVPLLKMTRETLTFLPLNDPSGIHSAY